MPITKLKVPLKNSAYSIFISDWELNHSATAIKNLLREDRLFILTNPMLKKLYAKKISSAFEKHFRIVWLVVPEGERHKNLSTCEKILTQLSHRNANRQSLLLALGGGVVGDIAGFVAAIYMRGIRFVQMPTTLLAQVDSSVGGKTGVDLRTGKNLVGSFHQPQAVFIHTGFLKTLPRREFLCGMAEVIKYGVIADRAFFSYLEKNREAALQKRPRVLARIVRTSCQIKARIVAADEKENSLRAILNYGHTLGHAVEALSGFKKIKHGEAVSMGMVFAAHLGSRLRKTEPEILLRIRNILKKYELPTSWPPFAASKYQSALRKDKKSGPRNIRFILPQKLGKVAIVPLRPEDIVKCL